MEEDDKFNLKKEEKTFIKILLMGKRSVGKTSMKSLIFHNLSAKDTLNLALTNEIEETHLKFMKDIYINIIDCCSQKDFIDQYFDAKKKSMFSNVGILVFVAEAENFKGKNVQDNLDDITYFEK